MKNPPVSLAISWTQVSISETSVISEISTHLAKHLSYHDYNWNCKL